MSAVEAVVIPEKLFYRINEVATITGVKPYVLRYWESEFPMLNPEKDENDQRRYRKTDIELVLQIKQLLYEDRYTIAGARKQLKAQREGRPEGPTVVRTAPTPVNLERYRQVSKSLTALRDEINDLFKILGQ